MREPTAGERESVNDYIESISAETGVRFVVNHPDIITKQSAIKCMQDYCNGLTVPANDYDFGFESGVRHCINLIDILPWKTDCSLGEKHNEMGNTTESTDVISRRSAIMALRKRLWSKLGIRQGLDLDDVEETLFSLSSFSGKWVTASASITCSECGTTFADNITDSYFDNYTELPNYCPQCGAKMEGEV